MKRVAAIVAAAALALALTLTACTAPALAPAPPGAVLSPQPESALQQPEAASPWEARPGWSATRFMVAAAHPLAADAGYRMLAAGGSALDAAIAVQLVLALVEPQSSGLGGGALLMHWDGREVQAWDGRETAPAGVDERLFIGADGRPLPFGEAVFGGRAVATPGLLRMLESAHRHHGKLPWAQLFDPAIALAEGGFEIGVRLYTLLEGDPLLRRDAIARGYFYRSDGAPHPVGHRLRNPALATLLRAIAARGSDALYRGAAAAEMVARVRDHAVPGSLNEADLAAYRPRVREPICTVWRMVYRVCGFPPPSSGHLAMMQILGQLEQRADAASAGGSAVAGVPGAAWLHFYTEASRLAFADRAAYVADPDFVEAPAGDWRSLLAPDYLAQRAALIGPRRMASAPPGRPRGSVARYAAMPEQPEHGTSQISVVDGAGRAVAMTTTIESAFGARVMADGGSGVPGGYLLNNEMTDFSFVAADATGRLVANRVQPGKRPRSSMSPTLVFDARSGRVLMSLGSPGGPLIIHFTAKTLIASLQWGLDVQRAIDLPNFGSLGGPVLLEHGRFDGATLSQLRARGHPVLETALTSGLQAIERTPQGWYGGADPRREGWVRGD